VLFRSLEDDPYSQLRYKGNPVKAVIDIARDEYNNKKLVTSVKSFSKVLGPGLRIAYVMGPEEIIKPMISWIQKVIVSPDCVSERVVAQYMYEEKLAPHIQSIREFYAPYLEKMLSSLEKYMPKEVTWSNIEGGIFLWLNCPDHINTDELFKLAKEEKISFIPGSQFYPSGYEKRNALRLNFSYPTLDQIEEGIMRLANILKKML
jgi:2-aminoadipate transaminase